MKQNWKRALALFTTLCMLMALLPAALAAPGDITYVLDEDGIDSGAVYAIYTSESDNSKNRILYHTGTGKTDKVTGAASGNELTLNGGFDASRQLWSITAVEGGYTVQSVNSGRYLDLSQTSSSNFATSDQAVPLTITLDEETGLYTMSSGENYLSFAPNSNGAFLTGSTGYGLRLFKQTEEPEPEPEPTDPLAIPGYTQLTEMPADGLDTSKYYLVVTKDSEDNLYALYINQAGTNVGPGSLSGANGACTATLTVSGDTVTAAYLNGGASVDVDDLRITVNTSGDGYTFRSGNYGLALGSKMFSTDYTALSVSADEDGLWTIKNTTSGRLLSFNQKGSDWSQYPGHITDFWGPNGGKNDSFPIYLYVQDGVTVPVDKGALNAAIDEATALGEADYTADSWSALQTALAVAQGVANNNAATQAQVNEACAALEAALDALVGQVVPPEDDRPTATAYIQDTNGIDSGAVYAIYTSESDNSKNRILYHTGTGKTDKVTGAASGNELTLNGGFDASRQLWSITAVEGGYTVQSVNSGRYLDLSQTSSSNFATSDQAVPLTITLDEETGLYTMSSGENYLSFAPNSNGAFLTGSTGYGLRFFKQTEVPAETVEVEDLIPAAGTTQDEPFAPGTGGSNNFRIPSIITLDSGRILAAIDARWNHLGDACALDTILSYSDDGGETWHYSFPNYFGDSVDAFQSYATAFIDPLMVQGNDGTIYLLVDLFPGGVAINTAPMRPAQATGYVEIDGVQRLVLYLSGNAGEQTDSNYACYVGDFTNGYAQIYDAANHAPTGYYVDDHYYLYYSENTTQNPEQDKIYCQQLGSSKFIQQNVFFYNAQLHVRCATYLWLVTSTDGGETWSAPTILNPQVRTGEDMFYGVGPGAGLCLEDGTIIMPAYTFSNQIASFVYSMDGGETWHRSEDATSSGHWSSESCLVQIDETTVRHFYRDGYSTLYYTDHTWNGKSWEAGSPVNTNVPNTSNNQLSAITYSRQLDGKDVILVSTATGAAGGRTNGKIYTFTVNEDKTMTLVNTYEVTASGVSYGYSSLTELADGSIAVLYEAASSRSTFVVISCSDLGIPAQEPGDGGDDGSDDGNDGSGSGSSSGGSSSGSSSSGNKTETVKNPDGSTTTTVTKPNGTVTETTKYPDGSSEVVETKKDGTVTTTATDKTGNKTEVVENPDGSSQTTVDNKDGSSSVTKVDEDGKVEAQVTLPAAVVEDADGEAVTLPMPEVRATADRDEAPTITVDLPRNTTAKVEIPVRRVTTGTVAVLVHADGSEEVIKNTLTTDNGVTVILSDGDTVKIVDNSKEFVDVPDSHWAAESVTFAASRELFNGTSDVTFSPAGNMTRAMIVTVLARYDGVDTTGGNTWYEAGAAWAVTNGVSDGTNLDGTVSREQLVTMLWRLVGSPVLEKDLTGYPDTDEVSDWAIRAMVWAVENGILTGNGAGELNSQGTATRAEVATMLMRFVANNS
ncbi:exo-alpha-sialidase [uncultured Flavonifractor sp.]|uniref:exo-alpha-sialidase n=1 Tax=uncultured Flavonifractor sp. TaxID=1193534 RepID=UPI002613FAF3|nr:exo-alpha-sialidase [uncultured Flavonifractor sp.]